MPPVLVSLEELEQLPADARVVDARWKLGDPSAGRAMFEQGHIPGAVFVDMDQDLASAPGASGRHRSATVVVAAVFRTRARVHSGWRLSGVAGSGISDTSACPFWMAA